MNGRKETRDEGGVITDNLDEVNEKKEIEYNNYLH